MVLSREPVSRAPSGVTHTALTCDQATGRHEDAGIAAIGAHSNQRRCSHPLRAHGAPGAAGSPPSRSWGGGAIYQRGSEAWTGGGVQHATMGLGAREARSCTDRSCTTHTRDRWTPLPRASADDAGRGTLSLFRAFSAPLTGSGRSPSQLGTSFNRPVRPVAPKRVGAAGAAEAQDTRA